MKNAKIDYSIADKEAIDEAKEVKVGSIVGNTVQGFNFKVLSINGDNLEVENTKTGKKMTTNIDNMYLPTVKEAVDETSVDKLDQEAKIYFMQQFKQGKIKKLPKDPKAEYIKIKMSKDNLKEIIREKLAKILK